MVGQLLWRAKHVSAAMAYIALASASVSLPHNAQAQGATPANPTVPTLSEQDRCAAIQAISDRLRIGYIYPDQVPTIVARLDCRDSQLATNDPAEFARRVTHVLQAVSRDSHLYLNFQPDWFASATSVQGRQVRASQNAEEVRHARNFNFGIAEQTIMPGNIRYLKLVGFFWTGAESARAYAAAMRFLHDGRAIIIDLRSNRGGDTEAMYFLLSHFLRAGATITTIVSPGERGQRVRATQVPASGRISGTPLYILVSNQSRSAAEAVAHTVRQFQLGQVVGERTEGANHISDDTAIAPWFRLSVPLSYTLDPVSNSNWEGVGVEPTMAVAASDALGTAYRDAVERLLATTAEGEDRTFLAWAREGACAIEAPYGPSIADLASIVGSYGPARIEMRNQAVWLVRPERPDMRLRPLCPGGLFEADGDDMFRIRISSDQLEILRPGSIGLRYERH